MLFSPDSKWFLKFGKTIDRSLLTADGIKVASFVKLPFYQSDDNPLNLSKQDYMEGFDVRHKVAPFQWWQHWREATRSYRFSHNSRRLTRFTSENHVALHNLETGIEEIIWKPEAWLYSIIPNDIEFDDEDE